MKGEWHASAAESKGAHESGLVCGNAETDKAYSHIAILN